MQNHLHIIKDEEMLRDFIDDVLPTPSSTECFMVSLFARKKYLTEAQKASVFITRNAQLRREFAWGTQDIIKKIRLFECPNVYTDHNGNSIPESCFVMYITTNPRNIKKAGYKTAARILKNYYDGQSTNPLKVARIELQNAYTRYFVDIDIDVNSADEFKFSMESLWKILGNSKPETIITKGGAHILLRTDKIDPAVRKTFHEDIKELSDKITGHIEFRRDALLPIPGCKQADMYPIYAHERKY